MMTLMRPVVDFLNRLKDEKQSKEDEGQKGPLEKMMDAAKPVAVTEVETRSIFESPPIKVKQKPMGPKLQKIQYDAPVRKVEQVKKALGVHSFKEVGEKTFDYFYEAEVGE